MGLKISRIWSGPVKDLPEEYMREGVHEDCLYVTIYSDGSRIYDRGLDLSQDQIHKLSYRMSKCWDSLPIETQISINNKINHEK